MSDEIIRQARLSDAERILEIYAYYVTNTAISFEYDVPELAEFQKRMKATMEKYPYLVIEKDGILQGYAYAAPFHERAAYSRSCELSIYLAPESRKCGYGRKLYGELEKQLREGKARPSEILNLYACIAYTQREDEYLDNNSAGFHEHMGFGQVGYFHKCGYKFGRWYDMIWMEKMIGEHLDENV
ncbi:MAG: N-acetyltransferase family protein [Lachnospiraceae bacterium]|nr:N-acetyltransferase family protein [Lachnospiraceae bacterium]